MRIRQLRADEGAVLLSLWNAAGATPSPTDTVDDLERALGNDRFACLVAEAADGVVVGSIIAAFDGWRGNISHDVKMARFVRNVSNVGGTDAPA